MTRGSMGDRAGGFVLWFRAGPAAPWAVAATAPTSQGAVRRIGTVGGRAVHNGDWFVLRADQHPDMFPPPRA